MRRRLALALALALAGGPGCGRGADGDPVLGTLERDRLELVAESNDPIVAIEVREGDALEAGREILRQDDARLRAQLATAEAARDQARARLAELTRGPRAERIAEGRARLSGAQSALQVAQRELERLRALASQSVRSRADLDVAQGRYDAARAERDQARAALEALLDGTTAEELEQASAAAAGAEAAAQDTVLRLGRLRLLAPVAGNIDALPFEVGERPAAGAVVAVLLAGGAPYARVYLPQELRVQLAPGAAAAVSVPGLSREFSGRVRSISHEAAFTPYYALTQHDRGHLAYLAKVDLVGAEASQLPTGVPVEVRFQPAGGSRP